MAGTLVANTINTDTGLFSTNNAYSGIAKAWVYYNGSTQTVNASFNVSSVTYNGTGDYTINFTIAMPSANYASALTSSITAGSSVPFVFSRQTATAQTASLYRMGITNSGTSNDNAVVVCATFFSA